MKCPELFESRAEVDVTEPRLPRACVGLRMQQKGKKKTSDASTGVVGVICIEILVLIGISKTSTLCGTLDVIGKFLSI